VFQHTLLIPLATDLRLGILAALELVRQALWVAGIVVIASLGAGVFPLLSVPLVVNLALIVPTALLVRGRISARLVMDRTAWPPLLRATVVFSLATAVGTIYIYATQILTSLVASRHESGLFAVSFRVVAVSATVPGLLAGAALPVLSRAARDDRDRLAYALGRIFDVSLVGGVGAALVLSAGSHFVVSVVAGPRYAASAAVLGIQAFALVASFLVAGSSFGLLALREHRGLLAANAAALLVSVVLTLVLASSDGARGAAIATICGETTLAAASLLALVRRRPEYRPELSIVVKVAGAGVCAALGSLWPAMPSVLRPAVAAAVYAVVIVATRAVPRELAALIPSRRVHS
jgi:O-antigen/teichoic acid export membrane protein